MVGGTCGAAAAALDDGRAAHLGGGLHHAFANHGEGFCPLNDVAVAIRVLAARSAGIRRAAIVDCDVHHGNGTSMIFERDADVFTFSIHQQLNYPFFKPRSDLDIGLEDGAGDDRYLEALAGALPRVMASRPELIVYLAGADPFEGDRLGGLKLTQGGARRARSPGVDAARAAGVPLATVLAGGYAADVEDTVDIHTSRHDRRNADRTRVVRAVSQHRGVRSDRRVFMSRISPRRTMSRASRSSKIFGFDVLVLVHRAPARRSSPGRTARKKTISSSQ